MLNTILKTCLTWVVKILHVQIEDLLFIITGVNLGMLLETLFAKDMYGKDELITYLMKNGKDGIQYVNDDLQNKEGDEI